MSKLSIVIPAFNEGKTIHLILDKIKAVRLLKDIEKEIIIVDDGSTDNTQEIVQSYQKANCDLTIRYLQNEKNSGKGFSLNRGLKEATGDYLIVQDADMEYDPEEYNILLKPMLCNGADVVYGSRFMGHQPHRILFYWHSKGNKFLTGLSNMMTNLNLTDMETCYKLMRASIAKDLKIKENRFGIEPFLNAPATSEKRSRKK